MGLALAAGVLWGPVIAAVPLVTSSLFPGAEWKHSEVGELFGKSVALQALDYPLHPTVVGLFGIVLAFALTRIQKVWISRLVFFCLGVIFFVGFENQFSNSPAANFLNAGLTLAASYELFRRFDLLALITGVTATTILSQAALLFLQPSHALRGYGWRLLGIAAAMLGTGVALLWKAQDSPEGEQAITRPIGEGIRSAREELKSEFSIAQRAQREMLPSKPPVVPGFSISAHCTPAKEVGGDLYDFLPLSGDRLGIAVADVSGKGVPAALYMTLTKGLLAATTQDELHLSEIMAQINGHIHSVARRKTFVTMYSTSGPGVRLSWRSSIRPSEHSSTLAPAITPPFCAALPLTPLACSTLLESDLALTPAGYSDALWRWRNWISSQATRSCFTPTDSRKR